MIQRKPATLAVTLAAAIALPLLAGCLTTGTGGEITARDAANLAAPRAQQWQADAALMVVAAFELPVVPGNGTFGDEGVVMAPDASPGNGRAPQWFLAYHSAAANTSLEVVAYGNGTVVVREDDDGNRRHAEHTLAGWQVDSPQAVAAAREDANFSAALAQPGSAVLMALSPPDPDMDDAVEDMDEDPFWMLMAGNPMAGEAGAIVFVNARNGSRIPLPMEFTGRFPFGGGVEPAVPQDYTFTGTLTPVQPEAQHAFEVEDGYTQIVASLGWDGTLPTDGAVLEILGPDGHAHPPLEEESGDGTYTARFAVEGPGEHVAVVRLSSSAPVGVSVTYGLSLLVVPG